MKIGIIGAGQIGGTLTRRLRALGHEVHVGIRASCRGSKGRSRLHASTRTTSSPSSLPTPSASGATHDRVLAIWNDCHCRSIAW